MEAAPVEQPAEEPAQEPEVPQAEPQTAAPEAGREPGGADARRRSTGMQRQRRPPREIKYRIEDLAVGQEVEGVIVRPLPALCCGA